jgi:hypothetical protein
MFLSISPFYGRAIPLALLFIFLIIYYLLNKENSRDYIIIGVLNALLFATRHDFGIYAIASTICVATFENKLLKEKSVNKYLIYLTTLFANYPYIFSCCIRLVRWAAILNMHSGSYLRNLGQGVRFLSPIH